MIDIRLDSRLLIVHDMQMQIAAGTSQSMVIVPRESPSPATLDRLAGHAWDMQRDMQLQNLNRFLLQRTELLKMAVSRWLLTTQRLHKLE